MDRSGDLNFRDCLRGKGRTYPLEIPLKLPCPHRTTTTVGIEVREDKITTLIKVAWGW